MAEKKKVLVVDDENKMRKLIGDYLVANHYDVIEALSKFYNNKDIAIVLLDVMMPKIDGWETLETIRKDSKVPVIMLTAKSEEEDELHGFRSGADDYVQKPFSPQILMARIKSILNRNDSATQEIESDGIRINKVEHQVYIDGEPIELSFKEFELLEYLLENKGVALSREKILNNVWNFDYYGDARTIDTHIKKLRSKLGTKGDYIKTIWGMGYKYKPQ